MLIRLGAAARPHPDSFDTLAEFFAAFAEWERFYEPWEKRKSTRSKRGYIAWNPETKKPAYGKQADKVLGPKKERKKTVKANASKPKTKTKPKVTTKQPKATKPTKTKTPPVTKVPSKAKAQVVPVQEKKGKSMKTIEPKIDVSRALFDLRKAYLKGQVDDVGEKIDSLLARGDKKALLDAAKSLKINLPKGADTRKQITQYLSETLRLEASRNQKIKPTQSKIKTKSKPIDRSKQQTDLANGIMQAIERVNATSPNDASMLSDIYSQVAKPLGATRGEYQDAIRHLWRNGHVRLVAWTRPLYTMRGNDDEFAIIIDKEIRNYVRTTSSDKISSKPIKIENYSRPSEETTRLWKSQLVDRLNRFYETSPAESIRNKVIYDEIAKPLGVTIGQFHDGLRDLWDERKIYLSQWTQPLYAMPDEEFALIEDKEIRSHLHSAL